jgi:hypothetical protein
LPEGLDLVFNASTKPGYRLPGTGKYRPAFRAAAAGGNTRPRPPPDPAIKPASRAVPKQALFRPYALESQFSRYPRPGRDPAPAMAAVLRRAVTVHNHNADRKMVDTQDVTPHEAPVDISMKDLPI